MIKWFLSWCSFFRLLLGLILIFGSICGSLIGVAEMGDFLIWTLLIGILLVWRPRSTIIKRLVKE